MEFLKDVATPQSLEHFHLLLFVLNILLIVYVPYLGFLLGSAFVSYRLERRYRRSAAGPGRQVAGDLIATALQDPKVMLFMGVVPALALIFVFTQLLQGTTAMSVALLAFSAIFLVAGAALLLGFRFTFRLRRILESVDPAQAQGENERTAVQENDSRQLATGRWGTVSVAVAMFLLAGALALSADPDEWARVDGVFALVFSASILMKYAHLLAISAGVTGAALLFYLDQPEASQEYRLFVRRLGTQLAVASILAQPVLVLGTIALLPASVLSAMLFGVGGASLVAFLLAAVFVYGVSKEPGKRFASLAFVTVVVAVGMLMTGEQVAVHNATQRHAVVLALEYEKVNEEFKASLGITAASFTGEDIYNGRCSACHLPDARKVGPSFRTVAAKYAGKREALVTFIRNPVKVDPDYPPMPNQGLRPAEVDSIATYLLQTFGPEGSSSVPTPPSN
jgi:cytochrome c